MFHFTGYNEMCEDFNFKVETITQAVKAMKRLNLCVVFVKDSAGIDLTDLIEKYSYYPEQLGIEGKS